MVYIKSRYDIEQIKKACSVWKDVRDKLIAFIKEGVSLLEIDQYAQKLIEQENHCKACFHGYNDFPGHICISVNDVVIHGVPTNYKLKNQDMVTCDVGVELNSYICDAAFTVIIGDNSEAQQISDVCYQSLMEGIKQVKPENTVGDISHAVQSYVESKGYKVIRDFGGHGCGKQLHEDPIILNYGKPNTGMKLRSGMVICIEPMILTDNNQYYIDKTDNWSVIAKNHKLTCHWEHMVLVTEDGCEILTE